MRIFFKRYGIVLLAALVLIILSIQGFLEKKSISDSIMENCNLIRTECLNGTYDHSEICPSITECVRDDSTTVFHTILLLDGFPRYFSVETFTPLLIIVITTYWFHQNLNSGNFKNQLMRMDYSTFLKKNYKRIIKIALILPCFLVFLYILAYSISSGFVMDESLITGQNNVFSINIMFRHNIPLYLLFLLINIFLNSIFYSNLALFTARKFKNIIISIVSAYLLFLALSFLSEVVIARIIWELFHISMYNSLSMLNFYAYDGRYLVGMWFMFLFALFLALSSSFINYCYYKNKERVIIDSEK